MTQDVQASVDARVNFFVTYVTVPPELAGEVNQFITSVRALGEASANAQVFEEQFNAQGLSAQFNGLIAKCPPKAYEMSQAEKEQVRANVVQSIKDDRKDIAAGVAESVLTSVELEAKNELSNRTRQHMIDNGTLDDYTRASNAADYAKSLFGFFKRKK